MNKNELCACGSNLKCCGVCRKEHTNQNTGKVECEWFYSDKIVNVNKKIKKQKFNSQKDFDENKRYKHRSFKKRRSYDEDVYN